MPVAERTEKPLVIRFELMPRAKIRYGRARLTVVRFGGVGNGEIGDAIGAFERGSIDAEDLCWEFVRNRVTAHTPSFDWKAAELSLLLDRVIGVSTSPQFGSSTAEDVARVLVDMAEEERAAAQRMRESVQKWAGGLASQFDSVSLPVVTAKKLNASFADLLPSYRFGQLAGKPLPILGLGEIKMPMADWHLASKTLLPEVGTLSLRGVLGAWPDDKALRLASELGAGLFANRLGELGADFGARGVAKQLAAQLRPSLGIQTGLFEALRDTDWAEFVERNEPHNWEGIYGAEKRAVIDFMLETGINLAWAPRLEIVRELLGSGTEIERNKILVRNREQILEDVETALGLVAQPQFQECVDACREIVGSWRSGFPRAAQTLAGTALSDLVHRYLRQENFGRIRRAFEAIDPMHQPARHFSFYLVGRLWARALGPFSGRKDSGYNRAESAHVLGEHFHEAHLLQALLLLAGLLCEFKVIEDEREGDGHEFAIALLEPARA